MKQLLLAFALVATASGTAFAQRDAGAKARGDFFFYARSGESHVNAAHAHASHYHGYLGQTHRVSPTIARLSGTTLTHHIDSAQQHAQAMRDYFVDQNDTEPLATVDVIDKHLAAAKVHHAAAQAHATETPSEPAQAKAAIEAVQTSLDAAKKAHEELIKQQSTAKKPPAKKK